MNVKISFVTFDFTAMMVYFWFQDLIPFAVFFAIIMTAFAYGIQIQFQKIPEVELVNEATYRRLGGNTGVVMYELILIALGLDSDLTNVAAISEIFR